MTKAIILGATGEVGSHVLDELLKSRSYKRGYVLGRSSIESLPQHLKMEKLVIDLEQPQVADAILQGVRCLLCHRNRGEARF